MIFLLLSVSTSIADHVVLKHPSCGKKIEQRKSLILALKSDKNPEHIFWLMLADPNGRLVM